MSGGHEERKNPGSMYYHVFGNRLEILIIIWERKYLDRNGRLTEVYGSLEWRKKKT